MKGKLFGGVLVAALVAAGAAGPVYAASPTQDQRVAMVNLEAAKGSFLASQRLQALKDNRIDLASIKADTPASNWFTRVKSSEVNMVTNRFEGKRQAEINANGKTFYGTGDGAAAAIANNPSICNAKDPLTGETVNKSEAVIFANASGKVYYFKSEHTFKGLLSLATPDTVYGYTAVQR